MVLLGTLRCQKVPQGQVARGHPSICSPKVILNITMVFLRCLVGIWRTGWAFSSKVWLPAPKSIIPVPAFIHTHKKKKRKEKKRWSSFFVRSLGGGWGSLSLVPLSGSSWALGCWKKQPLAVLAQSSFLLLNSQAATEVLWCLSERRASNEAPLPCLSPAVSQLSSVLLKLN